MKVKNVIITGANGYLGNIVKDHLKKSGFNCIELVRNPKNENSHQFILGQNFDTDKIFLEADWLIHTAYDFSANKSWEKTAAININGSFKLFEKAVKNHVKIIFISSISSFENCKSNYGKSKRMIEEHLLEKQGENYIISPGLIYGEQIGGITESIMQMARFPVLFLPGAYQKGYLVNYKDILNLIDSIINNKQLKLANKPIIAANSTPYTLKEVFKILGARIIIPFPWKIAWLLLKFLEIIGFQLRTGSDSIVSLMNPKTNFEFNTNSSDNPCFSEFDTALKKRWKQ